MNRDEAIALVNGPLGEAIREIVVGYVAPIFIATPTGQGEWNFNNGSCFFLDCGKGPFLVTANHIFQEYLARKKEEPRTVCHIFNLPFEPEKRLIDSSQDLDIATFRISLVEINMVGVVDGRILSPKVPIMGDQSKWPPDPPECTGCVGTDHAVLIRQRAYKGGEPLLPSGA